MTSWRLDSWVYGKRVIILFCFSKSRNKRPCVPDEILFQCHRIALCKRRLMRDVIFISSLSRQETDEQFSDFDFFNELMDSLSEVVTNSSDNVRNEG